MLYSDTHYIAKILIIIIIILLFYSLKIPPVVIQKVGKLKTLKPCEQPGRDKVSS